jgi:pimeloyl-ACP methyl ester carboxylesterase
METFASGGLTLAYDDIAGTGAGTVVLVHGFATSAEENWRRLGWYGAFERRGSRVVALDLRGHGRSETPHHASAYDVAVMVADVIALMDHLEIGRANLMGYSLGARIASMTASNNPERIDHLVLGGVGETLLTPRPVEPGAMTMAEAMRADDPATITDATLRGFRQFADNQGEDRLALAACSEGLAASVAGVDFGAIRAPTLVVAGSRDDLAGSPDTLAEAIAGAKAVTLPGCDHFSAIPHALFKAAVFDFLEGWEEEP